MNKVHGIKTVLPFAFIVIMAFFMGCKESSESSSRGNSKIATPEEVAEKYAKAHYSFDYKTMRSLATERLKKYLEEQEKKEKEEEKLASPEIKALANELFSEMKKLTPKAEKSEFNDDGDKVKVHVVMFDKDGKENDLFSRSILLVKENDTWKVDSWE